MRKREGLHEIWWDKRQEREIDVKVTKTWANERFAKPRPFSAVILSERYSCDHCVLRCQWWSVPNICTSYGCILLLIPFRYIPYLFFLFHWGYFWFFLKKIWLNDWLFLRYLRMYTFKFHRWWMHIDFFFFPVSFILSNLHFSLDYQKWISLIFIYISELF